jgi:hypothetical protein
MDAEHSAALVGRNGIRQDFEQRAAEFTVGMAVEDPSFEQTAAAMCEASAGSAGCGRPHAAPARFASFRGCSGAQ